MNRRNFLNRLFLVLMLSSPAFAWALSAGTDYVPLERPVPADNRKGVEVVEVFAFSCPHCYQLEPVLQQWLSKNKGRVKFVGMPVVGNPSQEGMARAFYAAQALGKEHAYREALFDAIHKQGMDWQNPATFVQAARQVGLDPARFQAMMNSFSVAAKVNQARQLTEEYGVTGVPSLIVAGRYRTSPAYTGGDNTKLMQVVGQLVQKARSR